MHLAAIGLALFLGGGTAALFTSRWPRLANLLGAGGAVAASLVALVPTCRVLGGHQALAWSRAWAVPYGSLALGLDALSAFFLLIVLGLSTISAVYGAAYLLSHRGQRSLGPPWFFFNLLVGSMMLVVMARNTVLFLVAWEIMSLASFFLVTFEHQKEEVRQAGWTYLVATHLGTACLLVLFVLLGTRGDSLDFERFGAASYSPALANAAFLLAIVGFGVKAGFMPFHVWLPEAHPAAPSHVSAVMSGVMIKTGIYGLLRTLTFLGAPPAWWAWLLIGIGATSGVLGILFALAQHDLKRVLAYSSIENVGIITMGIGTGLLGLSVHCTPVAVLGFAGSLLHVLNHATFKGLLFLGAGSVLHACHTAEMDYLGGLLKRMPWTAWTFLVGAAAITGLPPLNGFVSEFLIYLGAFEGIRTAEATYAPALVIVLAGLALIGGLAAACFAKAISIVFLGEARTEHATNAHECGLLMRLPMAILAAVCILIGLTAPLLLPTLATVVGAMGLLPPEAVDTTLSHAATTMTTFVGVSVAVIAACVFLVGLRHWLLKTRSVSNTVTWGCGYARPTARMQYTASSFTQPLTAMFRLFLRTRTVGTAPKGYFPAQATFATHTPDGCREMIYRPLFLGVDWLASRLRWLQQGRVQIYILYIALTLFALLAWKLG